MIEIVGVRNEVWTDVARVFNSTDNRVYVMFTHKGFDVGVYVCGEQYRLFTYDGVCDSDTVLSNILYKAESNLDFRLEYEGMFKIEYCGMENSGERRGLIYYYNTIFIDDYMHRRKHDLYITYSTYDGSVTKDTILINKHNAYTGQMEIEQMYMRTRV